MFIHLRTSPSFLCLFLMAMIGSEASILYSSLPGLGQLILSIMLLLYSGQILWKDILLRSDRAVVRLLGSSDNSWQLEERSSAVYPAILSADSVVTAYGCLLRFKMASQWRKRSCVVFKDAIGAEPYRQLLMKLRMTKIKKSEDASI